MVLKRCSIKKCWNRPYGGTDLCLRHIPQYLITEPSTGSQSQPREYNTRYDRQSYTGTDRERRRQAAKRWRELNPQKHSQSILSSLKKWRKANPEKRRAYDVVRFHRNELVILQECDHQGPKQNHHPDYEKPLEVMRLCRACHLQVHSRKGVAA